MLRLAGSDLTIELLDPAAEADRLGPRFCGGGFVWQVRDRTGAPLCTGPEWPSPQPDPFNGQGLPESFRHRTLAGQPLTWRGDAGVALGAGEIAAGAEGAIALIRPCTWDIESRPGELVFSTTHTAAGFAYQLRRRIVLEGTILRSVTELTNRAAEPLAGEWFAHPFFALPEDGLARAELPPGSSLAANPGFELSAGALHQKRRFRDRDDGHFDYVHLPPDRPLEARLAHPRVGAVELRTSFVPSQCIVWGNDRTFSLEPYLRFAVAPGTTQAWQVEYRFGAS